MFCKNEQKIQLLDKISKIPIFCQNYQKILTFVKAAKKAHVFWQNVQKILSPE